MGGSCSCWTARSSTECGGSWGQLAVCFSMLLVLSCGTSDSLLNAPIFANLSVPTSEHNSSCAQPVHSGRFITVYRCIQESKESKRRRRLVIIPASLLNVDCQSTSSVCYHLSSCLQAYRWRCRHRLLYLLPGFCLACCPRS